MKKEKSKRKNRILFRLIAAVLSAVFLSLSAPFASGAAESGTCGESLTWTYDGGKLTISGSGEMINFFDDNMPPWYSHKNEIVSVVVEEGVTSLGELAFFECESLTNAILPSTLETIGIRAFKDCVSLSYLNIPPSLYVIAESAFENCKSLNGIRLPDGLVIIGDKAFYRCASLTSITIPASVNYLGMVVFAQCPSLVRADVLCPIENLPDWAFYGCRSLTDVSLPDTLKSVGDLAFYDCDNLSAVQYDGAYQKQIDNDINEGKSGISRNVLVTNFEIGNSSGVTNDINSSVSENSVSGTSEYVSVTETENSIISVKETVEYEVKIEESNDENGGTVEKPVTNRTVTDRTVTATVDNEEGWTELSNVLDEIIYSTQDEKNDVGVTVNVQLSDNEISGEWIEAFAGENITVNVTTNEGASWQFEMKDVDPGKVDAKAIDLSYSLIDIEEAIEDIKSDKITKIEFKNDIDFNSQVNVKLGKENARHYATLYQKDGKEYKVIQSVLIDNNGKTWFSLANIDKDTDYYIAIDVEGVSQENSVIPKTMYEEFGGLADENGVRYEITGRSSKWGITGGQFALYVGIALGFMILVVAVIMITRNHFQKVKLAEEERRREAEGEIDKDALYDEVLRDMLKDGGHGEKGVKEEAPKKQKK